jgi:hypothetical protein
MFQKISHEIPNVILKIMKILKTLNIFSNLLNILLYEIKFKL